MAKKFFYNRVYNTKRTIINLVIIGVCIIGVIICFIITSNFEGENHNAPEGTLSIKKEVSVEVNEKFSNELFFSKIENVDLDSIEISYPSEYDISKTGQYEVTLNINDKNYTSILNVVDTLKPELVVKDVNIAAGASYSVNDFVESCNDNSKFDCSLDFYSDGIDEDGNKINYASYKDEGTYPIKISAKDASGNQTVKETKLVIGKNNSKPEAPSEPVICKYGNNKYDTDNYLLSIDITTNNCAVSLNLYKDASMTAEINKLMETETIRLQKDMGALNLSGTPSLNRKVTAVINTTGDGIVGYQLRMTVTRVNNKVVETVVDYKLDNNGQRVFITNPYNLNK